MNKKPIKIGIMGLGHVGQFIYDFLNDNPNLRLML